MKHPDAHKRTPSRWEIVLLFFCLMAFLAPQAFPMAADPPKASDLVKQISFEFKVVDYRYSFTVHNHTDLDITSFKIADIQRKKKAEKTGSSDLRSFPIAPGQTVAVPAGGSESFAPVKQIWQDCDNIVSYVYYIQFSDGSKWGVETPAVSEIPTFALTYCTSYEVGPLGSSPASSPVFSFRSHFHQEAYFKLIVIVILVVSAIVIKKRCAKWNVKRKRPAKQNLPPDNRTVFEPDHTRMTAGSGQQRQDRPTMGPRHRSAADPLVKGIIGEYQAYEALNSIPGEKRLLHNLYIRKPDGHTTEIDCLFINQRGLFVIESKNYSGYIYGSPQDNNWTQVLRKNKHYSFYNPVRQNSGHIRNLLTFLSFASQDRFRNIPVFSIITFHAAADISNVKTDALPQNTFVIHTDQLANTILAVSERQSARTYSAGEITYIYELLRPCAEASREEKERHMNSIY